jgi:hypothetical protein
LTVRLGASTAVTVPSTCGATMLICVTVTEPSKLRDCERRSRRRP